MSAGEAFCLATSANPITLTLGEDQPHLQDTAAFASVRSGARSLSVYAGQVSWGEQTAAAGQMLSWAGDTLSIEAASLQALNEFAISCMRRANEVVELCYSKEDLDRLEADRRRHAGAAAAAVEGHRAGNQAHGTHGPNSPHGPHRAYHDRGGKPSP